MLELAVSGEVVNDGDFFCRFGLWLGPNLGSLRTCFSVCPFLRDLKLRRYSSPGTRTHRHFFASLQNLDDGWWVVCTESNENERDVRKSAPWKIKSFWLRWILKSEGIVLVCVFKRGVFGVWCGRERENSKCDAKDNSYQTRNSCLGFSTARPVTVTVEFSLI